jgi:hypothetical protein
MVVLGEEAVVMLAVLGPLTCDQAPVPIVGALPAIVTELAQMVCAGPATAVVGRSSIVMVTLFELGVQLLKLIVQVKTYTPGIKPVTVVLGAEGVVIVGVLGPLTKLQLPVPVVGVLPASVAVVAWQRFCAGPAMAVLGPLTIVTVTSAKLAQAPFVIVHLKT